MACAEADVELLSGAGARQRDADDTASAMLLIHGCNCANEFLDCSRVSSAKAVVQHGEHLRLLRRWCSPHEIMRIHDVIRKVVEPRPGPISKNLVQRHGGEQVLVHGHTLGHNNFALRASCERLVRGQVPAHFLPSGDGFGASVVDRARSRHLHCQVILAILVLVHANSLCNPNKGKHRTEVGVLADRLAASRNHQRKHRRVGHVVQTGEDFESNVVDARLAWAVDDVVEARVEAKNNLPLLNSVVVVICADIVWVLVGVFVILPIVAKKAVIARVDGHDSLLGNRARLVHTVG